MNQVLQDAFAEHREALLGFIHKRLHDPQLADDILHDLYLKVQSQSADTAIDYPKAYLYRMANNLIVDTLRRNVKNVEVGEAFEQEQKHEISPERQLEQAQQLHIVTQAINELPEKTREVFRLQRLQQVEKAQVASQMGISVNMVEKHLRRAVQFCRDRLKKLET